MIKIAITPEMTNSYIPQGWKLTDEPYKAYRAKNQDYNITLNIANGFDETKPSKIIKTKKGTILLVNCPQEEDEKIMLLTLRGGFRAGFDFICLNNTEIVLANRYSGKHCCPVQDLVVKFVDDSKLILRTGNRTYFHFNKNIIITWDKIFREDGYPINELLPENGEVIKGSIFTKNCDKKEMEVVNSIAEEISSFGLGVLINTYCLYGKIRPQLVILKDGNLENNVNYISFNFGFELENYSAEISRIKNYFNIQ